MPWPVSVNSTSTALSAGTKRVASVSCPAPFIAWLIQRTLQIPQTMAATGLFYVAILFVMVGEMLGRLVLYQTGLPL